MADVRRGRRAPTLALEGIGKAFGDTRALEDAHLLVRPGTVHALLGENGAGKSTLMRIAFGLLSPDAGRILLDGQPARFATVADALAAGLGMVQQHFSLVPALTVAENVALGGHGRFDAAAAAALVERLGTAAGLTLDPAARVGDLAVQAQQRVEIVKALARDAAVLILDEPTAVLAPDEARDLLAWVRRFADDGGSVVLITHKLADALAVADDLTVLRRGRVVHTAPRRAWTHDALVTAMLGDGAGPMGAGIADVADIAGGADAPVAADVADGVAPAGASADAPRDVVLALEAVTVVDARGVTRVRAATLDVRRGEILGIAAVEGSGQHELLRVLAGRLLPTRGTVRRPAVVGFVPEDRHRDALLLDAPLRETVALRDLARARGRMPWAALRERTAALMARFDVRGPGPDARARALSGGNQQKLVLARELDPPPLALVVENPTRGLDLRATQAVLAHLRDARQAGLAIVCYSSDLDEVLAIADRVVAMHDGAVHPCAATRDALGRAMLGASA
ncbi:MAG: ATP-binding cassette domain-containing protein [Gemmatimonadaceae bacterium]|jgi:simple sugar transport system ATP-binding protein|nr:ATP-binding cassette domain-containing protein [Gemmatimonadaceae bacterium]